ncbi:MAG: hypothetical protein M0P21_12380, partial [Methanoculleus sp.]|nr:hypothetical protein [Methanoculleus sp.]
SNDTLAFSGLESGWPTATRRLGIPYPRDPLTITLNGTAGDAIDRTVTYVYTAVNAFGEESANAYPTAATEVYEGQTVTLSGFTAPTNDGVVIDKFRIYRFESGSTTEGEYELIAEIEDTDTSLVDGWLEAQDDILETETWIPCPDDMQGLIMTSSGMAFGFSGKELYPSEVFILYAYPEGYRLVMDYDIVGLAYSDSTLFVLTTENPYIVSGVSPESLTQLKINYPQACLSKRSIVNIPGGCMYASPDGLVTLDASGSVTIISESIYTREQWQALDPSSMICAYYDRKVYIFFSGKSDVLLLDLDTLSVRTLDAGAPVYDAIYDSTDDKLYALAYADAAYQVRSLRTGSDTEYTYRTKQTRLPRPVNMSCARIFGEQSEASPVTAKFYCDETLQHTESVSDESPFRLPSGFLSEKFEIEVSGFPKITAIGLGTSVQEIIGGE